MSTDAYIPGEVARITLAASTVAGAAADPGALRLKVKPPTGAMSIYTYGGGPEIIKDAVGQYHADILLAAAGLWAWRWELDAPNAGAAEGVIRVNKSVVI